MLHCLAHSKHLYTYRRFFNAWGAALRERGAVRWIGYDRLDLAEPMPPGVYLLTDFERLLRPERRFVRRLHDRLAAHPDRYRVINDPAKWKDRFTLVNALADAGINGYRAYRLHEIDQRVRYPVFVRRDNDHEAPRSPLLHSRDELRQYLRHRHPRDRLWPGNLMVVEYSDAGRCGERYHKYAAMKIGDRLIARHVLCSGDWIVKHADVIDDALAAEEAAFVDAFAHRDQVARAFEIAGVDYGRIDYAVRDGRIRVWEINTNPVIAVEAEGLAPPRLPAQQRSCEAIVETFEQLIDAAPSGAEGVRLFTSFERWGWAAHCRLVRPFNRVRR